MLIEELIQYGSMTIAITLLIIKRKGMKKYIAVAMFASLYANIWCYIAKYYKIWSFPSRIFPFVEDISIPVNMVNIPILTMFWVRYCPEKFKGKLFWTFKWATPMIIIEVLIGKYTNLIRYSNGFKWYHSYILWLISPYLWLKFHHWLYK